MTERQAEKRPRTESTPSTDAPYYATCYGLRDHIHAYLNATVLKFAKLSDNAYTPIKGTPRSAGYDLRSAYDCVIPPRGVGTVKTDLQIWLPQGTYGRIAPRSGLICNHNIDVRAGVVDEDYTGNVCIVLFNYADEPYSVSRGDRVAQLICEKIEQPKIWELKTIPRTGRGADGFGSTGK